MSIITLPLLISQVNLVEMGSSISITPFQSLGLRTFLVKKFQQLHPFFSSNVFDWSCTKKEASKVKDTAIERDKSQEMVTGRRRKAGEICPCISTQVLIISLKTQKLPWWIQPLIPFHLHRTLLVSSWTGLWPRSNQTRSSNAESGLNPFPFQGI